MKPRGRPPLAKHDPSVNVHFRLPSKQYDLSQKQADQAKLTLADWMRRLVARSQKGKA